MNDLATTLLQVPVPVTLLKDFDPMFHKEKLKEEEEEDSAEGREEERESSSNPLSAQPLPPLPSSSSSSSSEEDEEEHRTGIFFLRICHFSLPSAKSFRVILSNLI